MRSAEFDLVQVARDDRDLFTIKAPRAGILLHGKAKEYRPGHAPARFERGSQLQARADVFLVADPGSLAVAVDVPESSLNDLREGMEVAVRPVASPADSVPGRLHLEPYPSAKSGAGEESTCEGIAKLERPIQGILFGMRAKVKLEPEAKSATPQPAKAGE